MVNVFGGRPNTRRHQHSSTERDDDVTSYVAEKKGCTATEYGLVFGIFELVVFVVSPLYGAHMNRLGPKKVFNAGILTTGTCAILFGMLDKVEGHISFITLSFIIRIIEAMGNAAFLTTPALLFRASLEMFFGIGLIAGPTIGGALYGVGGYTLPFALLGFVLLGAAVVGVVLLPPALNDVDVKQSGPSMISLLKIPGVLVAALSIISTSLSIGFLQATLEPHLRQFKLPPILLGVMFVINGGVYALSAPLWGWICDRPAVHPKVVTALGCVFVAAGFVLVGPAHFIDSPTLLWMSVLGLVLHGLGLGCQLVSSFSDALSTAIANGLPNSIETYGLVSGMWTSVFALGAFIGPTVSGVLFDSIGFRKSTIFVFILHAFVAVVVLMYLWAYGRRRKMHVSVSAGDLLQIDGTLDGSVLMGEPPVQPPTKSRRRHGISVAQSRPPAMNSLIACSSYKNRRGPWSSRFSRHSPSYGSLDHRFRTALSVT